MHGYGPSSATSSTSWPQQGIHSSNMGYGARALQGVAAYEIRIGKCFIIGQLLVSTFSCEGLMSSKCFISPPDVGRLTHKHGAKANGGIPEGLHGECVMITKGGTVSALVP